MLKTLFYFKWTRHNLDSIQIKAVTWVRYFVFKQELEKKQDAAAVFPNWKSRQ